MFSIWTLPSTHVLHHCNINYNSISRENWSLCVSWGNYVTPLVILIAAVHREKLVSVSHWVCDTRTQGLSLMAWTIFCSLNISRFNCKALEPSLCDRPFVSFPLIVQQECCWCLIPKFSPVGVTHPAHKTCSVNDRGDVKTLNSAGYTLLINI